MWPSIISFTELNLKITDNVSTLLYSFAGFVCVFTPLVIAPNLEEKPIVLLWFEDFFLAISIVLFIIIKCLLIFKP